LTALLLGYRGRMSKGVSLGLPLATLGVVAVLAGALVWADRGPPTVPKEYRALVVAAAASCPGLDSRVLAAQLEQESGWNPQAVSGKGAQGIAQFLPRTWQAYAVDGDGDGAKDVWNPKDAIPSAARFDCVLFGEVETVPGDRVQLMLAAYNAGASAVRSYRGVPPFQETKAYVDRIVRRSAVLTIGAVS
jgi:soluble lytic murein transglycosylase-like protein